MLFQDLPDEVICNVILFLPQRALLSLGYSCKSLYALVIPELYLHVLINSSKQNFRDDDSELLEGLCEGKRPPVIIRSLYSLTRYFKNLLYLDYTKYVKSFEVKGSLPDIAIHDLDFFISLIFPHLQKLQVLRWYDEERPLNADHLALLPSYDQLKVIGGNFTFTNSKLAVSPASELRCLDVSNFVSHNALSNLDLRKFESLNHLKVARFPSKSNFPFAEIPQNSLARAATSYECPGSYPSSYFSALFKATSGPLINLSTLTLSDISLSASDASVLSTSVNLSSLRLLSIVNCYEIMDVDEFPSHSVQVFRRTAPRNSFFKILAPHLNKLMLLHYDVKNNFCEDSSIFSSLSQATNLKQLAIKMYIYKAIGVADLTPYFNKLQGLASTLERLEFFCDFIDAPNGSSCPRLDNAAHIRSLVSILEFILLKVLTIPVINKQLPFIGDHLSNLKSLKVLRLTVTDQPDFESPSCNDCAVNRVYDVFTSTCLISQDYFSCPTTFTSKIQEINTSKYVSQTANYCNSLASLQFVRYDFKILSLLMDCRDPVSIKPRSEVILDNYDAIVYNCVKTF